MELGEDLDREGLKETPIRWANSISELFSGYFKDKADLDFLFKNFETKNDSMVIGTSIPVFSFCEHHMLPFFGTCNIGYIPDGRAIGVSKLSRIVDYFSRRLQIQERLTEQIAHCLEDNLKCKGVMITMRCLHLCMVYRGVRHSNTPLITSTVLGYFRIEEAARLEFLSLTKDTLNFL